MIVLQKGPSICVDLSYKDYSSADWLLKGAISKVSWRDGLIPNALSN
jgi:hypothetical protein